MGADGKVRVPTQAGGRGRGCGYNFRPQACSRLRRRLGSTRQDRCRRSAENLQWITQIPHRVLKTPLLHLAAPSSLWEAWGRGLFTPCTHRQPGQSVGRGAVRHSSRGPIGAHRAAPPPKLARGKRGSGWAGRGRTKLPENSAAAAAAARFSRRALTLPLWAGSKARARGRRPGA